IVKGPMTIVHMVENMVSNIVQIMSSERKEFSIHHRNIGKIKDIGYLFRTGGLPLELMFLCSLLSSTWDSILLIPLVSIRDIPGDSWDA
ncbi:Hypothetical predicted protein, partial [Pelobates cultripes]